MRKSLKIAALGLIALTPVTVSLAASNKDRVGLGSRKSDEQHPQASETKIYCTDVNAKVQAGKNKERAQDDSSAQVCQAEPATRSAEEVRADIRKVERSPNN